MCVVFFFSRLPGKLKFLPRTFFFVPLPPPPRRRTSVALRKSPPHVFRIGIPQVNSRRVMLSPRFSRFLTKHIGPCVRGEMACFFSFFHRPPEGPVVLPLFNLRLQEAGSSYSCFVPDWLGSREKFSPFHRLYPQLSRLPFRGPIVLDPPSFTRR